MIKEKLRTIEKNIVEYQGQKLLPEVLVAWKKLQIEAATAGFDLRIVSGFRSCERQCYIWNSKWSGERMIVDEHDQIVDIQQLNDWEKAQAILRFSMIPGTSRHHWGTDIDVYDAAKINQPRLLQQEYQPGGPCYPLWEWLQQHSHRYGFAFPYIKNQGGVSPEPWHISFLPVANTYAELLTLKNFQELLENNQLEGRKVLTLYQQDIYTKFIAPYLLLNKGTN